MESTVSSILPPVFRPPLDRRRSRASGRQGYDRLRLDSATIRSIRSIRSVDCVTRTRYLPISLLTCQDTAHWCALGGGVERCRAAKMRPASCGGRVAPGGQRPLSTAPCRTSARVTGSILLSVPQNESVLVVPLRSNASTLLAGAPIAAMRRRLKFASLFYDRLFLGDRHIPGQRWPTWIIELHRATDRRRPTTLADSSRTAGGYGGDLCGCGQSRRKTRCNASHHSGLRGDHRVDSDATSLRGRAAITHRLGGVQNIP